METIMTDETIVNSHLKSQTSRGTTNDQTAVTTDKVLAPIPNVGVPNPSASAGDWQTRDLNVKTARSEHPVAARSAMSSAPGNKMPEKTDTASLPRQSFKRT